MKTSYLAQDTLLQAGKYKIVRFLSSGGFGCTYEGEHIMLHKRIAIKEFFVKDFCNRDESTSHVTVGTQSKVALVEKLLNKFIDEAVALSQLNHPNIVSVSDVFMENGTAYYVMDFIDGKSLHQIVNERGALPESEAISYIREAAEALKYVHSLNRLHLDIKPGNIMVSKDGHAKLIDFGASKQYDEVDGENTSTLLGKTPGYAPIEQMGNRVQTFSAATDIYALGATFYKLITGNTPADATEIADDEDALKPIPKNISEEVRSTIMKSLEVRRKDRQQNINEFLSMLCKSVTRSDTGNIYKNEKNVEELNTLTNIKVKSKEFVVPDNKESIQDEETLIYGTNQVNYNGVHYVDLGLSVKWAKCNVGAKSEFDKGDMYPFVKDSLDDLPSDICGNKLYDQCRINLGGDWRLPTKEEQDELRLRCKWEFIHNRSCYKVTGPNGNSIILPSTDTKMALASSRIPIGCYWSGTLHVTNTKTAYYIRFDSFNEINRMNDNIENMYAIRGVIK